MAYGMAYTRHVLLHMLKRLQGIEASLDLQKRGFFPKLRFLHVLCLLPVVHELHCLHIAGPVANAAMGARH